MVAYTSLGEHTDNGTSWYGRLRSRNGGIEKHMRTAQTKNDSRYSYAMRKITKVETALGDVRDDIDIISNRKEVPRHSLCTIAAVSLMMQLVVYVSIEHSDYLFHTITNFT